MPKYLLDERGILTITNEADGGIFSIAMWFKRIVLILAVLSVIIVAILYFTKYAHFTDADYLKNFCEKRLSTIDISSNISMLTGKVDISYPFIAILKNAKGQPGFYGEVFKIVVNKAGELFNSVWNVVLNIVG